MVLLLNAAVMPTEGVYTLKRISKSKFQALLQEADGTGNLQSYIGYPETARLIERLTGIEVEVSREQAELTPGDSMLIVKLRHRIAGPASKETREFSMDNFEFYQCEWRLLIEGAT